MATSSNIVIENDSDLRRYLMARYASILQQDTSIVPIVITLPADKWLSANGLTILMTFIDAILYTRKDAKIYINLFDKRIVDAIIAHDPAVLADSKLVGAMIRKIIFYDSVELLPLLRERGIIVQPGKTTYDDLRNALEAFKNKRFYKYSSKMLALSPLIETEEQQHALTTRMKTLQNILYRNLFGRIDIETASAASGQIMFELVKNIYQHSGLQTANESLSAGFACAQINKFFLIDNHRYPPELCAATLEQVRPRIKGKDWRFLSISISDYGIGLCERIRKDLLDKYASLGEFDVGTYHVTKEMIADEGAILRMAISTDYSSKKVRHDWDEKWIHQDGEQRLEAKGYGLVYCMGFIARTFGRMQIRSGGARLSVFAKPEAPFEAVWQNTADSSRVMERSFDTYFDVSQDALSDAESQFPGTQVLIEIPVQVWG